MVVCPVTARKLLDQFSFRIYLKQNLLNIYVDDEGKILSEDISSPAYKELVQTIYLPPEDAENRGHQLMERNEDGSCNYRNKPKKVVTGSLCTEP